MELKVVKTYNKQDVSNPDKVIDRMESSWQAAYRNTQIAIVATVMDCYIHGDRPTAVKRANRIVNAVTVGGNAKAVVEWFVQMGFVVGNPDPDAKTKAFVEAPDRETLKERAGENFITAKGLMWWTLKPQNPFEGWTMYAALNKVFSDATGKYAKMAEEGVEGIDIPEELVKGLAALLEKPEV